MNKGSNTFETDQLLDDVSINTIGKDEISDMPDNENYLSDLKQFLKSHWSKAKEKLNEDVDLKVKYTGIGHEPFVELGKKIKKKWLKAVLSPIGSIICSLIAAYIFYILNHH